MGLLEEHEDETGDANWQMLGTDLWELRMMTCSLNSDALLYLCSYRLPSVQEF